MVLSARKICGIAAAVVGMLAVAATADQIELAGVNWSSVEYVSVVGSALPLNDPAHTGDLSYGQGVITGLYTAVDTKGDGTSTTWLTYCIDPIGDINIGSEWNATYSTGIDLANGDGVLYSAAYTSALPSTLTDAEKAAITKQKYAMISYLAEKYYYNAPNSDGLGVGGRSDLSLAFWEIARDFDGYQPSLDLNVGKFLTTGTGDAVDGFANELLAEAFDHKGDAITMSVWSPTKRPSQEFLTIKVPEPSTFSLLLLGMGCMAGFVGIRRKK